MSPWAAMLLLLTMTAVILATVGLVCLFLVRTCSAIATMLATSLQTVISPGDKETASTRSGEEEQETPPEPILTPAWESWDQQTWSDSPEEGPDTRQMLG